MDTMEALRDYARDVYETEAPSVDGYVPVEQSISAFRGVLDVDEEVQFYTQNSAFGEGNTEEHIKSIVINRITNIARYTNGDDIRRAMRLFGKEDWEDRVINTNLPSFVPNYHQILGKLLELLFLSPSFVQVCFYLPWVIDGHTNRDLF